jgi:hypothetical protein
MPPLHLPIHTRAMDGDEDCDSTINSSKTANGYYKQRSHSRHSNRGGIRSVVLFDLKRTTYHPIPCREDVSMEEALDVWYTSIEKHAMMDGALKVAADLRPQDPAGRGLEYHTNSGFYHIQTNRDRSVAAVLKDQAWYKRRNVKERIEDLIRDSYQRISIPCHEQATVRGKLDEVEAFPQWHTKLPPVTNEEFVYLNHNRQNSIWTRVSHMGLSGLWQK